MSNQQSFKSVQPLRVSISDAERLGSSSRTLGNPLGCPLSARNAGQPGSTDVYSRPQSDPTKTLVLDDAACAPFVYPASQRIIDEQVHRPILGPYQIGDRGPTDFMMGVSRDMIPVSLYTPGAKDAFSSGMGKYLEMTQTEASFVPQYSKEMQREPVTNLDYALQRRLQ